MTALAPGRRPATILDVAAAAGVSRQTVTRAMNDMPGISRSTRERVLAVASDLSYRPSRHARGLVSGARHQLGLVVNDLTNPFSPELAAAVVRAASDRSWNVMVADATLSRNAEDALRNLGDQVDVVVGYLGDRAPEWRRMLGAVPVVELDPDPSTAGPAVLVDPGPAIEQLADYLVGVGVRHPAILDSGGDDRPSLRGARMRDALERRGYLPVMESSAQHATDAADATRRLLARGRRLDAILAFNDLMALGALDACRRAGLDVPRDIRITGVDGLAIGTYLTPTLTTLPLDLGRVAAEALDLARAVTSGTPPVGADAIRRVENTLLRRDSA